MSFSAITVPVETRTRAPSESMSPFVKQVVGSIALSPVLFGTGFLSGFLVTVCFSAINPIAGGVFQGTAFAVTMVAQPIIKKLADKLGAQEYAPLLGRIASLIVASTVAFALSSLIVEMLGFGLTMAEIFALIGMSVSFVTVIAIPSILALAIAYFAMKRFCPDMLAKLGL
jgi:hypothetical protein